ncbi:PAS domain S-box protein [Candidatus Bathyarchaeota archaeon]|nr:PAS domain S-box protein [Candidatus Bathyarchaeota archaeon]
MSSNSRKAPASSYARSLIEASLDPLVTISAEGKITDVNKATEDVTGYSRDQLIGSDFSDYFTEPEKAKAGYEEAFSEGFVKDYPLAIQHRSGKITCVLYNATVYRNEAGKVQGVYAAARDITARKEAEEKLRQASLYARSLIEASLDPLVTISTQGKITDVNQATEDVTGYTRAELIGSDFSDYFTEPQEARKGYRQVFTEGFVRDYPLAIRHKDGAITDVLYNATLYKNEQGQVQGVFAAARDITERKKLDEALKRQADLIDLSPDAIIIKKPDDTITFWSLGAEKLYGYTKAEAIGKKTNTLLKTTALEPLGNIIAQLKLAGKWSGELLHVTKLGRELAIQSYWLAKLGNDCEVAEIFESNVDVTERKNSERLAAIGATAGMVGHDIRNPLQTIAGEIYLAKDAMQSLPDSYVKANVLESLGTIDEQMGYINKIVSDLQDYAKPLKPMFEEVDLKVVVEAVLASVFYSSTYQVDNIDFSYHLDEDVRLLKVDKTYLHRIIQNLVTNSIQAMPNGGKITLTACRQDDKTKISVQDTGEGIPLEVRDRLFTPLTTTKTKGQGFGLAVVKKFTESLGGTITFESEIGRGTVFKILLPA